MREREKRKMDRSRSKKGGTVTNTWVASGVTQTNKQGRRRRRREEMFFGGNENTLVLLLLRFRFSDFLDPVFFSPLFSTFFIPPFSTSRIIRYLLFPSPRFPSQGKTTRRKLASPKPRLIQVRGRDRGLVSPFMAPFDRIDPCTNCSTQNSVFTRVLVRDISTIACVGAHLSYSPRD